MEISISVFGTELVLVYGSTCWSVYRTANKDGWLVGSVALVARRTDNQPTIGRLRV